jgi:hypothetical protein
MCSCLFICLLFTFLFICLFIYYLFICLFIYYLFFILFFILFIDYKLLICYLSIDLFPYLFIHVTEDPSPSASCVDQSSHGPKCGTSLNLMKRLMSAYYC